MAIESEAIHLCFPLSSGSEIIWTSYWRTEEPGTNSLHDISSITGQNLYDVLWTVRTLRSTLMTRFSFHVEEQLSLISRVLKMAVFPLDFSISSLLGIVHDGVLYTLASWDASGYHECECVGIFF